MVPWFLVDVHKDGLILNKYNNTVLTIIYSTIAFWRKITDMQRKNEDMFI